MTRPIGVLRAVRRTTVTSIRDLAHARPVLSVLTVPIARQCRQYSTHPSKPPKQGQPLHSSHPHLVNSKHLTPGIPASEYEDRRKRLMESLGEGAVVICMGNTVRLVTQRMSSCRTLIWLTIQRFCKSYEASCWWALTWKLQIQTGLVKSARKKLIR